MIMRSEHANAPPAAEVEQFLADVIAHAERKPYAVALRGLARRAEKMLDAVRDDDLKKSATTG